MYLGERLGRVKGKIVVFDKVYGFIVGKLWVYVLVSGRCIEERGLVIWREGNRWGYNVKLRDIKFYGLVCFYYGKG